MYGVGKETERAYFYQQGGYEHDEAPTVEDPTSSVNDSSDVTPRAPLDLPLSQKVWIDNSVNIASNPEVRSGEFRLLSSSQSQMCTVLTDAL